MFSETPIRFHGVASPVEQWPAAWGLSWAALREQRRREGQKDAHNSLGSLCVACRVCHGALNNIPLQINQSGPPLAFGVPEAEAKLTGGVIASVF